MSGNGMSFKQARELKAAIASGKVQLIRPDANEVAREMAYISEVRNIWSKRSEYAKVLMAEFAGKCRPEHFEESMKESAPGIFDIAEEYAREDMRRNCEESIEVLKHLGRPVPEQLAFLAKVLGVEVPEQTPETNARPILTGPVEGTA